MKKVLYVFVCSITFSLMGYAFAQNKRVDPRTKNSMWLPDPVNVSEYDRSSGSSASRNETDASGGAIKKSATVKEYTTFDQLQTLINERLAKAYFYPERARSRGIEGTVNLLVDISPYGTMMDCRELGNSPQLLSQAAKQQLEQVFPLPVALEDTIRNYAIQITYKLQ